MGYHKFEYLLEIEKWHSISKAAKALYIAQPNLSKAVKAIEEEFGITIFRRTATGVETTREGYIFIRRVEMICNKINQLKEDYISGDTAEKLNFSITMPRASYISSALGEYMSKNLNYDQIAVRVYESDNMTVINNILDQGFHIGIIRYEQKSTAYYQSILKLRGLQHRELFDFQFLLLMSKENPLADKEEIYHEDLEDQIEIRHGDAKLFHNSYEDLLKDEMACKRKYINVCERGSQFELLMKLSNSYMWVSPLMEETLDRFNLVQKVCVTEKRQMRDVVIWPNNYKMNRFEKQFLKKLDDVVNTLKQTI